PRQGGRNPSRFPGKRKGQSRRSSFLRTEWIQAGLHRHDGRIDWRRQLNAGDASRKYRKREPMNSGDITVKPIADRHILRQGYAFDEEAYSGGERHARNNIPFALFQEWWTAHPTGFLCAFRLDEPFAVVGLFPVTKEWSDKFLRYQTSESGLRGEAIEA